MAYVKPSAFAVKMVDYGEAKIKMATRDALIRAYMAGALLALGAAFAVTVTVQTGNPLVGAILFPGMFSVLYLMGFDLLTGVFVLTPLAWWDGRPGITIGRVLRHWGVVFTGNFAGALTTAFLMAFVLTYGFSVHPGAVGEKLGHIGESRTLGYAEHGIYGWATLFIRAALCNWMVSLGVIGAMLSTTVEGMVLAMWLPIMLFFYMGFEHSIVNMFLFPSGLMLGGKFSIWDYLFWNEIPTALGNCVGGVTLTGLTMYTTHVKTAPEHEFGRSHDFIPKTGNFIPNSVKDPIRGEALDSRAHSDEVAAGSSLDGATKQGLRPVPDRNMIGHGSSP